MAKNTHDPIVSEELFNQVQVINHAAATQAKLRIGKYAHLPKEQNFYGKKFTCAECGAVMKMHRSISRKGDKAYYVFKCPTYAEHGTRACSDIKIRKKDLDIAVFTLIKAQMNAFINQAKIFQAIVEAKAEQYIQSPSVQESRMLRQKLESKRTLLSGMYVDLKEGFLTEKEYQHYRNVIGEDIRGLESQLSEIEYVKNHDGEQQSGVTEWQSKIEHFADMAEVSAEMVDAFIGSMKLHENGELEIELNFKDELIALIHACERSKDEVA